jgi:hypothetical protein
MPGRRRDLATREGAAPILELLRVWLTHNNVVIMTVRLVVIASKIIGYAITGV